MPSAHAAVVRVSPFNPFTALRQRIGVNKPLICIFSCIISLLLLYPLNTVYSQSTYQYKGKYDIGLIATGGSVFGASLILQKKVKPLREADIQQLSPLQVNRFDRPACFNWNPSIARLSDGVAAGSCLMYVYFAFDSRTKTDLSAIGITAFQSAMLTQSLSNAFKLTKRTRPFVYGDQAPMLKKTERDGRFSFYSAHTGTVSSLCFSFAFAHKTYMSNGQYNAGIWTGAILIPAIQGYLRVKAGKHFPTDVIAGYLSGFVSSYLMHRMHLKG